MPDTCVWLVKYGEKWDRCGYPSAGRSPMDQSPLCKEHLQADREKTPSDTAQTNVRPGAPKPTQKRRHG